MDCPGCESAVPGEAESCPSCGFTINPQPLADRPTSPDAALSVPNRPPPVPPFFAVPVWKLALMSFVTFGLYEIFWFYRNWQRVRVREQVQIRPFLRAFFGFFYCHACFERIAKFGQARDITPSPPITLLTVLWIAATISWRLPDPFWLISLLSFVFLLPMQAYANRINAQEAPDHDRNGRLTAWNWVGIVIGGCVFALDLIAMFALPA